MRRTFDSDIASRDGAVVDAPVATMPSIAWVGVNSTVQLIPDLSDPATCSSGWTRLFEQLVGEGEGRERLIPIQPAYVDTFGDIFAFSRDLAASGRLLREEVPTSRFSLSWPCIMGNDRIREAFVDAVWYAQDPDARGKGLDGGFALELTLSHRDSYPAALSDNPTFGLLGGWAHPQARESFVTYVQLVLDEIGPALPAGSVIYIANEPTVDLFDGYLSPEGRFPPGGTGAGRSLAAALVNQRDAFMDAGWRIRSAGFTPAIAINVRPMTVGADLPGASLLEQLYNWWLADALATGCIDNDFDGVCENVILPDDPAVRQLGITFYGTMAATAETVEFGLPGEVEQPLARRVLDFMSSGEHFRSAMVAVRERYADHIASGTLTVGVAEIGLSSGAPSDQLGWLEDYLAVAEEFELPFMGVHSIFEHAEFTSGEWFFHLIDQCDGACELTEWGSVFLETLRVHRTREE
ncbi:hypothetical protein HY634_00235 [Candidatus Uhrbacteria bacterium]|nr:hypothetical protein [Candidatus Uhrbacteria bacterium]